MPTYRRKYYLIKKHNDIIDAEEERENKGTGTRSTGKGTRSSTISGQALKNQINTDGNPL
jgi:hypothetical protein